MSRLTVTSATAGAQAGARPGEGKTTVAVALAYRLLAEGRKVTLLRARGPDADAEGAAADARLFASIAGGPGAPFSPADLPEAAAGAVTIVEAPGEVAKDVAAAGRVVVAASWLRDESFESAAALGGSGAAAVALLVPRGQEAEARRRLSERGLSPLGVFVEDGVLAAPRVSELARALEATYLYEDGDIDGVAEHIVIGSIAADPGRPYFDRHASRAILTRFDKTDVQLAALDSSASGGLACLILTGGRQPSPYLLDRAQSAEVPILLTRHETSDAVHALESVYGATRLAGELKLERLRALSGDLDGAALASLLA